jgi:hypothetical protein
MIRAKYAGLRVHRDRHHLAGEIGDLVDDLDPGERAAYQAEMFEHWRRDDAIAEQYGPFDNIGSRGHRLNHLRNRSGGQQWDGHALAHRLARAGDGRGLAARVVADEGHGATHRRRPRDVAVPDCVGGPVQTRVLAVPEADDTIVACTRHLTEQLGPGHGGCCQLLVESRLNTTPAGSRKQRERVISVSSPPSGEPW